MNFKPETTTITTITSLVKDILPKARLEDYAKRYYIPESELDTLAIEVIAEPTVSVGVKVIEFWYGLKNCGTGYPSYGMPQSYLKFQLMDKYVHVTDESMLWAVRLFERNSEIK